jgi:hypothetical protein
VPLLTPEAFDLGHRHPLDASLGESFFNFFEFERLDDGYDEFHTKNDRFQTMSKSDLNAAQAGVT